SARSSPVRGRNKVSNFAVSPTPDIDAPDVPVGFRSATNCQAAEWSDTAQPRLRTTPGAQAVRRSDRLAQSLLFFPGSIRRNSLRPAHLFYATFYLFCTRCGSFAS